MPVELRCPPHSRCDFGAWTTAHADGLRLVSRWFSGDDSIESKQRYVLMTYLMSEIRNKHRTDSQQSRSNKYTEHRSHFSSPRASIKIFVTRHSKLFCSSKILRAKCNRIWLRRYSCTDISNSWAFWMPIPQKVRYRPKTSMSLSVNAPESETQIYKVTVTITIDSIIWRRLQKY